MQHIEADSVEVGNLVDLRVRDHEDDRENVESLEWRHCLVAPKHAGRSQIQESDQTSSRWWRLAADAKTSDIEYRNAVVMMSQSVAV